MSAVHEVFLQNEKLSAAKRCFKVEHMGSATVHCIADGQRTPASSTTGYDPEAPANAMQTVAEGSTATVEINLTHRVMLSEGPSWCM